MKMRFFSTLVICVIGLSCHPALAQKATVNIIQDSLIDKAFALKVKANKEIYDQYFFRIQLYYGDHAGAMKIMESVQRVAPDLQPKLSFETPNYKVQVGPFKKAADAKERLELLKKHYRGAFLMEPKIR